ncbi:hypothetical protein SAMN05421759_109131 [Roseivivax lentus]|uniref:Uncharacterized protein n=1 Tax=Roseivivax lentus TaxID=633194 RepID=A0A1N7NQE5_9RHOB|nr:hypothetical protein SAMN05421759_109131 [Roseivivax lentus]
MFDFQRQPTRLKSFLAENGEGLQIAALLLGGRPWLRRVQRLIDDASSDLRVTRRMARELRELQALLHLEHVHDPERAEAGHFAELDPAAPYVEEICLMADTLDDALETDLGGEQQAMPSNERVLYERSSRRPAGDRADEVLRKPRDRMRRTVGGSGSLHGQSGALQKRLSPAGRVAVLLDDVTARGGRSIPPPPGPGEGNRRRDVAAIRRRRILHVWWRL